MQENGKTKTTLCINMLQLLNSGRVFKVEEVVSIAQKMINNS
jgi:hypothetical protein